jgi:hypothetical protein
MVLVILLHNARTLQQAACATEAEGPRVVGLQGVSEALLVAHLMPL